MSATTTYDYIFAGSGCAGLSLLMEMQRTGQLTDKTVLVVDIRPKTQNDRTWCFWEKGEGPFESIVFCRWDKAWFQAPDFQQKMTLAPYQYKMIRGIDFYQHCEKQLASSPQIRWKYEKITAMGGDAGNAFVETADGSRYTASYVFSSVLPEILPLRKKDHFLVQHFRGWIIETAEPVFNSTEATLMDFRVSQQEGSTFVYTMPFSSTRALVEYTLFSKQLLKSSDYEEGLQQYLAARFPDVAYAIQEEESGVIPMTNYPFRNKSTGVIAIGTAGGQTKASSGYTFQFIQSHSQKIVDRLMAGESPDVPRTRTDKKFDFYDAVLLDVLANEELSGARLFTQLFRKNKTAAVLAFLDNDTNLSQDLKIILSLPVVPFLKAAWRQR